jgi:hypothetical protein
MTFFCRIPDVTRVCVNVNSPDLVFKMSNPFFTTHFLPKPTASRYSGTYLRPSEPNPVDATRAAGSGQMIDTVGVNSPDYYNPPNFNFSYHKQGVTDPSAGYLHRFPLQPPSYSPAVATHMPWPGAPTAPFRASCGECWKAYTNSMYGSVGMSSGSSLFSATELITILLFCVIVLQLLGLAQKK